jgi:hypothetical protein
MTTVAEMMLETARFVSGVEVSEGTATAGATTYLTDTNNLIEPGAFWNNGTLFLKTCTETTLSGTVVSVKTFAENKLTFGTLSKTITAGDTYAVVHSEYSRTELLNAVLGVLRSVDAEMFNEATTVVSGQEEYSLPTGVKGLRRVQVKDSDGEIVINQHWHEMNSKLVFPSKYAPTEGTLQLIYCTPQGTLAETGTIHTSYDYESVKWGAIVNILRMRLYKMGKDDPLILDKLNEAKANQQQSVTHARRYLNTDMRLA